MCGLAGYNLFPGFHQTNGCLEHYRQTCLKGPDDSGFFNIPDKGIGLVHTRLAIQDLSPLAHQPMFSPDRSVVLVFNGEIYNFRELRSQLLDEGYVFQGASDTEVLLTLYLSYKNKIKGRFSRQALTSFLKELNGIFAFAIWDSSLQSTLICRDSFGVKPLYFQQRTDGFYFASELKALPPSSLSVDPVCLDRYLTFLWCPGDGTPVSEVQLCPGEAMWIADGSIQDKFLWYRLPVFDKPSSSSLYREKSSAISATESYLRKAVHRQLVSDVPVGAFLSGGLDSSSIVAFARELNPDITCFTIDSISTENDGFAQDIPYAHKVARSLGVSLEIVSVSSSHLASAVERMVFHLDEPLADPASVNVLLISQFARNCGIKVLLSGTGGDDLFTGYRRHLALQSEYLWDWLPGPVLCHLRNLTSKLPVSNTYCRRLRKLFSGSHLRGDERLVNYFRWSNRFDLLPLYTSEFRSQLHAQSAESPIYDFLNDLPESTHPIERMLSIEQRFFLADHNLNYTDKMSMAAGVEVRVPFLDSDLVDLASVSPTISSSVVEKVNGSQESQGALPSS